MRIKLVIHLYAAAAMLLWSPLVTAQSTEGAAEKAGTEKPAEDKAAAPKTEGASETPAKASEAPSPVIGTQADPATTEQQAAYSVKLKELEQRVNELKERIFRSKARLNLLKETVLHGVIAGSRAVIKHVNEMGSSFRLTRLTYAVDGAQIFSKTDDSGSLDSKRDFEVFNGSIIPGNHTISVEMVFRGHGYGIFSYLKGYQFKVRSSHTFTAGEGRQTVISVRAYEKGNITTELKDRPAIKFETQLYSVGKRPAKKD
ncbi:MAG: hypothetical protein H6707_00825 [Deltaproteobacteria bacterium]|nr:hypothetical protein [Deltaproteobacteria bacterium]